MKIVFQIVQSYNQQETASIVISFANKRYIFNVPETFQRFARDHRIKLLKGSSIFLTRLQTDQITGIFGLMLTLFEQSLAYDTKIYGPKNTSIYFDSIRSVMGYKILAYSFYDFATQNNILGIGTQQILDNLIQNPLFYNILNNSNNYLIQNIAKESLNNSAQYITDQQFYQDENLKIFPIIAEVQNVQYLSYVCECPPIPPKLSKEKIDTLKIPKNLINKLVKEGKIQLENGEIIESSQIQEEIMPISILIIVDCPNESVLEILEQKLTKYYDQNIDKNSLVTNMIHLGPLEIIKSFKYQDWLSKNFNRSDHLFTCQQLTKYNQNPEFIQVNQRDYKHFQFVNSLHKQFQDFFPFLSPLNDNIFAHSNSQNNQNDINIICKNLTNYHLSMRHFEFTVSPQKSYGYKPHPHLENQTQNDNLTDKFLKKYKKWQASTKNILPQKIQEIIEQGCDPEIIFLGTGSMMPSVYRNVSAILVNFKNLSVFLDCGESLDINMLLQTYQKGQYYYSYCFYIKITSLTEIFQSQIKLNQYFKINKFWHFDKNNIQGTYSQLMNQYKQNKTKEILKNLKIIFISHIHADHHIGLIQILNERQKIMGCEQLVLIIPYNLAPWIQNYQEFIQKFDIKIVFNQTLSPDSQEFDTQMDVYTISKTPLDIFYKKQEDFGMKQAVLKLLPMQNENKQLLNKILQDNQITALLPIKVEHCPQSYGLTIDHESGFKLVFSGDTKFSQNLIKHGQNATILIHEATYNDELQKNADQHMHSTIKDAVQAAMGMSAYRLVLTHYSQRYQKFGLTNFKHIKEQNSKYYNYLKKNTIAAFDHFQTKLSEYQHLPLLSKVAFNLFPEENQETDTQKM